MHKSQLLVIVPLVIALTIGKAFAVVQLIPLAVMAAESSAGAATIDVAASGLANLIGMTIAYFAMQDATGNKVRIPTTSDPAKAIPAPSAPSTAVGVATYTVGAGSQAQANACSGGVMQYSSSDPAAACSVQACFIAANGYTGTVSVWNSTTKECKAVMGTTVLNDVFWTNPPIACPTGYSGSSCTLSNARAVTSDKATDYTRTGTTLAPVAGDVDTSTNPVKGAVNGTTGVYQIGGVNGSNQPLQITITPRADGGSTVQINQQTQDAANNTAITTKTIQISPATVVESATQSQSYQALTVDPVAQTATQTATGNQLSNSTAPQTQQQTAQCGTPGQSPCAIDDSSFGSASNSASKITDAVTSLGQREAQITSVPTSLPSVGYSWVPSLFPGQPSVCRPLPINMTFSSGLLSGIGGSTSIDICDQLDLARQILGWLFFATTAVYIFRAFTSSNSGSA